jgi:translation initiation factor 1
MSNKNQKLGWEDFIKLGNPENAPDLEKDVTNKNNFHLMNVYVHYEKKGRGGKEAIIIKGIEASQSELEDIAKVIKNKLGVGGSVKDREIIISGNKRDKIIEILRSQGFKNIKKAGG